jgi:hypothetical protein
MKCQIWVLTNFDFMRKIITIIFPVILFCKKTEAQFSWHKWVVIGGINTAKYTHHTGYDKRIEKITSPSGKLGNIGIGYTASNKLTIGIGVIIEKYIVTADDTAYSRFPPQEFGNRKYEGNKIAPAIWAIYSLPITEKIYFNSELSISAGNRKNNLQAIRFKYTTAIPTETVTNYLDKETNVEIFLTPSVSYKISNSGFISFNFTEISFRKDINLTPEAINKDYIGTSINIFSLKFGVSTIWYLPQKRKIYREIPLGGK